MSTSNEGNFNFANANLYQNRSQTESSQNGVSFPSLNGTLSQSIKSFDICIAYNRENGYQTASLIKTNLELLSDLSVILYADEKEPFDLIPVESRIASSSFLVVILSLGALKSSEVLFALSAADYYYKDESQVLVLHDTSSCFIPGYQEQPPQFRKYFGDHIVSFFSVYASQGSQEILRRYEASKPFPSKRSSSKNGTAVSSSPPSNAISLGIQEVLDRQPSKLDRLPKRNPSTRTSQKTSSLSIPSSNLPQANLNNNSTSSNMFSNKRSAASVSANPPSQHCFYPSVEPTSTNSNNASTSSTTVNSSSVPRVPRRIPSLNSLSRHNSDSTIHNSSSSSTPVIGLGTNSHSKPPSVTSSTSSSTSSTRRSSTNTRRSDRSAEVPQSTYRSSYRTPSRSSSGETPSLGNIGMYPPSTPATVQENLDFDSLEDAELRLALEISKAESEKPKTPVQPPPNTDDDERIARALQEQFERDELAAQPVRTNVRQSPTRELSDELYALMLQDSENAPLHLQPVYNDDTDSEEDLPSAYDLFDAPPIPLFPGHAYNPYFTHTQQYHNPTSSSRSYTYGNQPDVDNMTYEELLELEERMGKAKSEGATKQQISALPTRRVTKSTPDAKCSVCQCEYEEGQQVTSLPCFHSYHSECIENWLTRKKTCPECLKEIEF